MYFSYPGDFKEKSPAPGILLKLVWGERVMLSYATFQPNSNVPRHSHPAEQTGMVIEGELDLAIGDDTRLCRKGDAFTIPGGVEHSAASRNTPAIVLESFSPPREDYM